MNEKLKSFLHRLLRITIFIKGIDGAIDSIAGSLLLFSASGTISKIIPFLVRKELVEDPNDIIGNYLLSISQDILADTQLFVAIYLIVHGLIKIGLALAFNSRSYKAYEIAKIFLIIFTAYQLYRFSYTHSMTLLLFTSIDVLIIILVDIESKKYKPGGTLLTT